MAPRIKNPKEKIREEKVKKVASTQGPQSVARPLPPKIPKDETQITRDKETGQPSSFTKDGLQFFGPPEMIQEAVQREQARRFNVANSGLGAAPSEGVIDLVARNQANQVIQEATPQLRRAGAFEDVNPKEVSLQPQRGAGEGIPVAGPAIGAFKSVLLNAVDKGLIPFFKRGAEDPTFDQPLDDETIREEALRYIKKRNYKKGISAAESFGSFVEGIPIAGGLARQYAAGLIETPSANADQVINEINSERERAATNTEKISSGRISARDGLVMAREMEEHMAELEGRLQILINTSPILRANVDEVNSIQEKIIRARERIDQLRDASAVALTGELTGTRATPTDQEIFNELKELNS